MPVICEFPGAKICMYYDEHFPPHVHVYGGGFSAAVSVPDGVILKGKLPPGTESRVRKWVRENAGALMENWNRAQRGETLFRVPAK